MSDIRELAQHIFGGPPKQAGTIQLELDDNIPPNASNEMRSLIVSEILMALFIEGIRIRFDINSGSGLTEEHFEMMAHYFRSFGYCLLVRSNPLDQPPKVREIPRNDLCDFSERFYDFEQSMWHEISFQALRIHKK